MISDTGSTDSVPRVILLVLSAVVHTMVSRCAPSGPLKRNKSAPRFGFTTVLLVPAVREGLGLGAQPTVAVPPTAHAATTATATSALRRQWLMVTTPQWFANSGMDWIMISDACLITQGFAV
ncbi:MAG: hypothetical protein DLM55_03495 [Acidimicrobiales bacterium]|nr:MAG: hypothetical protein DLM55_03495 [Acidimicrobiales bacterium]